MLQDFKKTSQKYTKTKNQAKVRGRSEPHGQEDQPSLDLPLAQARNTSRKMEPIGNMLGKAACYVRSNERYIKISYIYPLH